MNFKVRFTYPVADLMIQEQKMAKDQEDLMSQSKKNDSIQEQLHEKS